MKKLSEYKSSSRILFITAGVFIIWIAALFLYMNIHAEYTPNAYYGERSERLFYFDELKSIKISKGFWKIKFVPSDRNFIKVEGELNILNYHLLSEQTGTGITFTITDSIKEDFLYKFYAEIHTNSLRDINFEAFSNMLLDSVKFDTLNVTLKDESILQIKDCEISEMNLKSYNIATLETNSCKIENFSSSMYDSSYAIIYSAENISPKIQKGLSALMIYQKNKNIISFASDSSIQQSNIPQDYIAGIKLPLTFQKPARTLENNLDITDSIKYMFSFWEKPQLSPERFSANSRYTYHSQSIVFHNKSIIEGIQSVITFNYSRGLLNSVSLSFNDVGSMDSIYNKTMRVLKEGFDFPVGPFLNSSYSSYMNEEMLYYSNKYINTESYLWIMRNMISREANIYFRSQDFLWDEDRFHIYEYWYPQIKFSVRNFLLDL